MLILTVLLSGACIGIRVSVPVGGSKAPSKVGVVVGAGPLSVVIVEIRTHLKSLRDDIPMRRARLHPISCGTETCYSLDEVRNTITQIRRDAQAAFPEQALASSLTIDDEIARATNHFAAFRRASLIQLVRNAADNSPQLVRAQEVDAAFDRAKKPIDTYLAHKVLNPTLRIRSTPAGAQFRMLIGTNEKTVQSTATQGTLKSVWRGRYTGTMSKKGYREVAGFAINLFDNDGTTVDCTLVPNSAPDTAVSLCWLRD